VSACIRDGRNILRSVDVKRKPERLASLLKVFSSIHCSANPDQEYSQAEFIDKASKIIEDIDIDAWIREKVSTEELANNIQQAQQELLKKFIKESSA